ncbi:uncharacterized protein LOC144823562 [Lissotriton helveticus]
MDAVLDWCVPEDPLVARRPGKVPLCFPAAAAAYRAESENPGASRRLGPSRRVNHHRHRAPLLRILLLSPVQNPYHPPVPTGTAAQRQRSWRGTGGSEAPTPAPAAVGEEPTAVGDVTPSKRTRKELAVRARQRKLQAIVEAYRRLVAQAEEEEEAAAAAAASSNAPAPKPAGVRRRGQAAARHRIFTSSAPPPQHACQCRCREFHQKILRRVARLEEERVKLEDGIEERVKLIVDKHLKARRL